MKKWVYLGAVALAVAIMVASVITWQDKRIEGLRKERDRYAANADALMSEVKHYVVRDSLSAARVQSLELSLREYERYRAEDAAIIRELKGRNRDLAAVNETQTRTIIALSAVPKDTVVIVRDSVKVPAVSVHCGDAWYSFDGVLTGDAFTGRMEHRDSLLLVETVKYKRFLWWKTKRVKDRTLDAVTKSPHNTISGLEHVLIEK